MKANTEVDFSKREEVYIKHREVVHHQIRWLGKFKNIISIIISISRTSNKAIQKLCRGLFSHPDHLAKHFTWLTNVDNLNGVVEENLHAQLGKYLAHNLITKQTKLEMVRYNVCFKCHDCHGHVHQHLVNYVHVNSM